MDIKEIVNRLGKHNFFQDYYYNTIFKYIENISDINKCNDLREKLIKQTINEKEIEDILAEPVSDNTPLLILFMASYPDNISYPLYNKVYDVCKENYKNLDTSAKGSALQSGEAYKSAFTEFIRHPEKLSKERFNEAVTFFVDLPSFDERTAKYNILNKKSSFFPRETIEKIAKEVVEQRNESYPARYCCFDTISYFPSELIYSENFNEKMGSFLVANPEIPQNLKNEVFTQGVDIGLIPFHKKETELTPYIVKELYLSAIDAYTNPDISDIERKTFGNFLSGSLMPYLNNAQYKDMYYRIISSKNVLSDKSNIVLMTLFMTVKDKEFLKELFINNPTKESKKYLSEAMLNPVCPEELIIKEKAKIFKKLNFLISDENFDGLKLYKYFNNHLDFLNLALEKEYFEEKDFETVFIATDKIIDTQNKAIAEKKIFPDLAASFTSLLDDFAYHFSFCDKVRVSGEKYAEKAVLPQKIRERFFETVKKVNAKSVDPLFRTAYLGLIVEGIREKVDKTFFISQHDIKEHEGKYVSQSRFLETVIRKKIPDSEFYSLCDSVKEYCCEKIDEIYSDGEPNLSKLNLKDKCSRFLKELKGEIKTEILLKQKDYRNYSVDLLANTISSFQKELNRINPSLRQNIEYFLDNAEDVLKMTKIYDKKYEKMKEEIDKETSL